MMKRNSKLLISSVSAIFIMTASASANDYGRYAKGVAVGTAVDAGFFLLDKALNNNGKQQKFRAPPGHTNLGPVNKQQQRSAPAKQAPKARTAVAKSTPKAAAPVAVTRVADPQVLEAQKNLAALGFSQVGKPDGFAGKGTAEAVRNFEETKNLPLTGVLTPTIIALIANDVMVAKANPPEAETEVAEIKIDQEMEPEDFVSTEAVTEPNDVVETVVAPEIEKAPEKPAVSVPTAVAAVSVPETKKAEAKAVEKPAVALENEW